MEAQTTPDAPDVVLADDPRVERLVAYIQRTGLLADRARHTSYGHMGATITDVALQARWNYTRQVRPRAKRVRKLYPEAATTSEFRTLIADPHTARTVLDTRHDAKIRLAQALAALLADANVETEERLRTWVDEPGNRARLRAIRGVGPKTSAYLAIRVGAVDDVAIDVHLRRFLRAAQVETHGDAAVIIARAARSLGVTPADLDGAIWRYQSQRTRAQRR